MRYYDKQLQELQEQVALKRRLEYKLKDLEKQHRVMDEKVQKYEVVKYKEQEDVDKLERMNLTSILLQLTGKKQETLDLEKAQAYEALLKYNMVYEELKKIKDDYAHCERELGRVRNSEREYERVLEEKAEAIKKLGINEATKILELEANLTYLESQKKELKEAINAGKSALGRTDYVLSSLDSAKNWSTFDMLGGGVLTDMVKHDHLRTAQNGINSLQSALRRFKTELTDIKIESNIQVEIEGFLHFADYFFDGLFVDWMVHDKINQSKTKVSETKDKIQKIVRKLDAMLITCDNDINTYIIKKEELVKITILEQQ